MLVGLYSFPFEFRSTTTPSLCRARQIFCAFCRRMLSNICVDYFNTCIWSTIDKEICVVVSTTTITKAKQTTTTQLSKHRHHNFNGALIDGNFSHCCRAPIILFDRLRRVIKSEGWTWRTHIALIRSVASWGNLVHTYMSNWNFYNFVVITKLSVDNAIKIVIVIVKQRKDIRHNLWPSRDNHAAWVVSLIGLDICVTTVLDILFCGRVKSLMRNDKCLYTSLCPCLDDDRGGLMWEVWRWNTIKEMMSKRWDSHLVRECEKEYIHATF